MTQLMQPQGQDHHMLPRTNLGKTLYHHGQQDHIIYYDQEERSPLSHAHLGLDGDRGGDACVGAGGKLNKMAYTYCDVKSYKNYNLM